MLWYKGWFETRIKLAMSLGFLGLLLSFVHFHLGPTHGGKNPGLAGVISGSNVSFLAVVCVWLAGAGIATQAAFQATKGLHGSTLFTLSLPVSRLRLLAVRAGLGWLEVAASIVLLCCGMWVAYPPLRESATAVEMVGYAGTLMACGSAVYFLSVLLATFLEDQWRMIGTMVAFFGMAWLSIKNSLPVSIDIFRAMGKGSPLLAHAMPWTPMAFALGLGMVFFLAALKVVQAREY